MLIGDKYKVEMDSQNITLFELVHGKKKDRWVLLGYFNTFTYLLKFLVDYDVQGLGLADLQAIKNRQVELYLLIESLKDTNVLRPS